jgi:SAM-dependent methyltransferase
MVDRPLRAIDAQRKGEIVLSNADKGMSRYVHPKSAPDPSAGQHDLNLDIASDSATAYLRWIADLLIPHLGTSALEVGSGHGSVTQYLADGRRLVATDLSDSCLSVLRSRFADSPNVEVRRMDLREVDIEETFDSTIIINLLEHIRDDAGALSTLRDRLKPGGNCLIYVPALNWLYGPFDRDVGHYRRYSKRRLASVVREAGLQPVKLHYVNMLAIPAWALFSSRWLNRNDAQSVGRSLQLWDRVGVPLTRAMERRVPPPMGLNLFCVARKP